MANNDDWLGGLQVHPVPARDRPAFHHQPHAHHGQRAHCVWSASSRSPFLEFNYMILQGYDFVELNKRHDCSLQMGGSDQWGNIVQGVELGQPHRPMRSYSA